MSYRGRLYLVAGSTGTRAAGPSAAGRQSLPNRTHGIRYTASPRPRGERAFGTPETVQPVDATAVTEARLSRADVEIRRIFAAIFVMLLVALASAMLGIGLARAVAGPLDQAFAPDGSLGAAQNALGGSSSDPVGAWKQGSVPVLYQDDPHWADRPYGQGIMATSGAAPLCLAMVHAQATGDASTGPVEIASFAQSGGYADAPDASALLTDGAGKLGLAARPVDASEPALRRELVSGRPVIAAVHAGSFGDAPSFVVLVDIDKRGMLVLHDPSSPDHTARPWSFDEVLSQSDALWSYTAAL